MRNSLKDIHIARVSTIPFFVLTQLRTQLEALIDAGAEVTVITSNDELSDDLKKINGGIFKPLTIAREIKLFSDVITLFKLWKMFQKEQFDIVHSTTPKAGLLCAIAAKLSRTKVCVHTYTGQPWVTMSGLKKYLLKFSDKLIGWLNVKSYTDSFSQNNFLISNKIVSQKKLKVIGKGSLAGVNLQRFNNHNYSEIDRNHLRDSMGISNSTRVLLFVGRLAKEKGIFELIEALSLVLKEGLDVVLIVIGPFEQNNENEIRSYAKRFCVNRVIFGGFQVEPERFMSISDILCLPSYREGFGTVVIEAAAMGLPAIGTRIYGLTDAIIDEVTGILVDPESSSQLADAIKKLISDENLRKRLGMEAQKRAFSDFDSNDCNELLIQEYKHLLCKVHPNITN